MRGKKQCIPSLSHRHIKRLPFRKKGEILNKQLCRFRMRRHVSPPQAPSYYVLWEYSYQTRYCMPSQYHQPVLQAVLTVLLEEQVDDIVKAYSTWFDMSTPIIRNNWALVEGRRVSSS